MIVLDASVLIAHLDADDAHHDRARTFLGDIAGEGLAANLLTLAEVLVGPARIGQLDQTNAALRRLQVDTLGFDQHAPVRLATLWATTSLRLPDCCVLLATEQTDGSMATFDERLAAAARSHGHTVLGQPA